MVVDHELSGAEVDRIFRALADANRRDIVGEATVSQPAQDYALSFAAVQQRVALLETAGLATKEPSGRE